MRSALRRGCSGSNSAGAIYHVSARGNERRLILRDDQDRKSFLENLAQAQGLHQPRLYLVLLMPNHFHLLLETPAANLSALMARLLTGYAVDFSRWHHHTTLNVGDHSGRLLRRSKSHLVAKFATAERRC
jgi:REP element-mobilizing transposase RayT